MTENDTRILLRIAVTESTVKKIPDHPEDQFVQFLNVLSTGKTFKYTLVTPGNDEYGTAFENGTATGMLGMLPKNQADVTKFMSASFERFWAVDFSDYLDMEEFLILSVEKKSGLMEEDILDNFLKIGWRIAMCFVIGVVFLSIIITTSYSISSGNPNGFMSYILSFIKRVWDYGMYIFCGALEENIPTPSGRIGFAFFAVAVFFFLQMFTGLLETDMVTEKATEHINTVADVIKRPYLRPLIPTGTIIKDVFEMSKTREYQKFWKQVTSYPDTLRTITELEGDPYLKKISTGKYLVLRDEYNLITYAKNLCLKYPHLKIHMSNSPLMLIQESMGYRKSMDPETKEKLNQLVRSLVSSGIYAHWMAMKYRLPHCLEEQLKENAVASINFEELQQLFLALILGEVAGGVILMLEITAAKCKLFCHLNKQTAVVAFHK